MRISRFYLDQSLAENTDVTISGPTRHYLTRVLRLRTGAELIVFDGTGGEYAATLTHASRETVQLALGKYSDPKTDSPLRLTLAQGVARGERMDQILQKSTELGVSAVVPLQTDRTVVRFDDKRRQKRMDHWQKVIINACEQCGRNILPVLHPLQSLEQWLASSQNDGLRIILQPGTTTSVTDIGDPPAGTPVSVLIGPEGGLAPEEQRAALEQGFRAASLGPRILRTETASMAVLSILQSRWGDAR